MSLGKDAAREGEATPSAVLHEARTASDGSAYGDVLR